MTLYRTRGGSQLASVDQIQSGAANVAASASALADLRDRIDGLDPDRRLGTKSVATFTDSMLPAVVELGQYYRFVDTGTITLGGTNVDVRTGDRLAPIESLQALDVAKWHIEHMSPSANDVENASAPNIEWRPNSAYSSDDPLIAYQPGDRFIQNRVSDGLPFLFAIPSTWVAGTTKTSNQWGANEEANYIPLSVDPGVSTTDAVRFSADTDIAAYFDAANIPDNNFVRFYNESTTTIFSLTGPLANDWTLFLTAFGFSPQAADMNQAVAALGSVDIYRSAGHYTVLPVDAAAVPTADEWDAGDPWDSNRDYLADEPFLIRGPDTLPAWQFSNGELLPLGASVIAAYDAPRAAADTPAAFDAAEALLATMASVGPLSTIVAINASSNYELEVGKIPNHPNQILTTVTATTDAVIKFKNIAEKDVRRLTNGVGFPAIGLGTTVGDQTITQPAGTTYHCFYNFGGQFVFWDHADFAGLNTSINLINAGALVPAFHSVGSVARVNYVEANGLTVDVSGMVDGQLLELLLQPGHSVTVDGNSYTSNEVENLKPIAFVRQGGVITKIGSTSPKNPLIFPLGDFSALPINDSGIGSDGARYALPNVDALVLTLPNKADMNPSGGIYRCSVFSENWASLAAQPTKLVFDADTASISGQVPDTGSETIDLVLDLANDRWIIVSGGDVTLSWVIPSFDTVAARDAQSSDLVNQVPGADFTVKQLSARDPITGAYTVIHTYS